MHPNIFNAWYHTLLQNISDLVCYVHIWALIGLQTFILKINFKINLIKFVFSKKATKIEKIFTVDLTLTT